MEDHHGAQTLIRSAEDELNDRDRMELKYFIRESCGIGGVDDLIDVVADIALSSSVDVDCDTQGIPFEFPALYLTAGILSHSCSPNTRLCFNRAEGFQVTVYSSVKICRGEKLTRSAAGINKLNRTGTKERRKLLQAKLIDCLCERCQDPTEFGSMISSLLCSRCKGSVLPDSFVDEEDPEWKCEKCGKVVEGKVVEKITERLRKDLEDENCEDDYVNLKDFLLTNSSVLHPDHFLMTRAKEGLFALMTGNSSSSSSANGISVQEKLECVRFGMDLLKLADLLEPGVSKLRGKLLLNIGANLQQMLAQEVQSRLSSQEHAELDEKQIYSAFRDALFCFEEAKRIQRMDKSSKGKETYSVIKSSIHVLKEMKKDWERSFNN